MSSILVLTIISLLVMTGVAIISYTQYGGFEAHAQFLKASMEGAFVVCSLYWVFEGGREAAERFEDLVEPLVNIQLAYWFAALLTAKLLPDFLLRLVGHNQSSWTVMLFWTTTVVFCTVCATVANAHRLNIVSRWLGYQ